MLASALSRLAVIFTSLTISQASVIFDPVPHFNETIKRMKLTAAAAQTIRTFSALDRLSCALACRLDSRCRSFLHDDTDHCALLSSPWRPQATEESETLMMRRVANPGAWRFNGSEYSMTKTKGSFTEMKAACAARGMHLWHPSSHEEMRFVEREILSYLPENYFEIASWSNNVVTFTFWLGVIDRPNGNCLLSDEVTKCPVDKYSVGNEPVEDQECTNYRWLNGVFEWDDIRCGIPNYFGFCESALWKWEKDADFLAISLETEKALTDMPFVSSENDVWPDLLERKQWTQCFFTSV